ncbi:GreA/GreB family elongation factor [Roseateles sp.]|uniref:GreA/GreB family elongation factor n=1 Tax=Roseateles sp. TaxID=1971397 RepID=UPI003BAADD05
MFPVSSTAVADRLLSELDHQRLRRLALQHEPLQDLLDSAELLPPAQLPADVVSMNSEVEVVDPARGQPQRLTLCYPAEARPELGCISVLSPVGLSLLGRAVGAELRWPSPAGRSGARLRIQALLYQPESSGDLSR